MSEPVAGDDTRPDDDEDWTAPVRRGADDTSGRAEDGLTIALEGYEGPLDLLLALARTQKVDLAEISVVDLADQYLAFIGDAQRLRLAIAGDYLVMAAWLTFLKSRLLIPKQDDGDDEMPAEELARRLAFRLARLKAMREAASALMARDRLGQHVFARGSEEPVETVRERVYSADIYDLLKAYADRCNRLVPRRHVVRQRLVWSIKDARQRLERLVGPVSDGAWVQLDLCLEQFMPTGPEGRTALASSFGASLEMAREGHLELRQARAFAPLFLRPVQRQPEQPSEAVPGPDASSR